MHIAFVNNTGKWGGVKTWCLNMAKSFVDAGHRAVILGRDEIFIEKARNMGLAALYRKPGPDYNPFAIAYYYNCFKRQRVTAVVVNVGKDLRTAGVAARLLGLPLVHRIGAPRDFRNTVQTRMDSRLLSPAYLCCSNFVLDALERNAPHVINHDRAAIHPGVTVPDILPERVEHTPLRLVTTSRLSSDKKHIDLLVALTSLRDQGYDFHLSIVGTGPAAASLQTFVREHSLDDRVKFCGFTTNVTKMLRQADIFVLPTWCEPLGISLEEAMAEGLVPVARNAGGVPEIWPPLLRHLLTDQEAGAEGFHVVLERLLLLPKAELQAMRSIVHSHATTCFGQEGQFRKFYSWVNAVADLRNTGGKAAPISQGRLS